MSSYDCLDLCRLCLVKDRVSVPIFEGEGDVRQIFLKITACLPVKVGREDKLPKKICDDCVYKVELLYEFWNTTANAEKQLLQWLGDDGDQDKQGYVSNVMNSELMKQETVENRLDSSGMRTEEHQNNMGMNMMDQMGLTMPIIMSTEQQITSVPMTSSGNNIQAVPGTSAQSSRGRKSGNNDDDEEESEEEENSDDECDNEEGINVKQENTETGRNVEPSFVNVSIPCDEAGPSGLQQQKMTDMSEIVMAQSAEGDPKSGTSTPYIKVKQLKDLQDTSPPQSHSIKNLSMMEGYKVKLTCKVCGEIYFGSSTEPAAREFARVHQDPHRHKCPRCPKKYLEQKYLITHLSDCHKEESLFCDNCSYIAREKIYLINHMKKKHPELVDKEPQGNKYKDEKQLRNRRVVVYQDLLPGDENKNLKQLRNRDVVVREKKVEKVETFLCQFCGFQAKDKSKLTDHEGKFHKKVKYPCKKCTKVCLSQEGLKQHMERHKLPPKIHTCDKCGKTFSGAWKLKKHLMAHDGVKPQQCTICERRFSSRSSLRQHLLTHTGKRPYTCDICGKTFVQKPALTGHRRQHPGELPPLPKVYIDSFIKEVAPSAVSSSSNKAIDKDSTFLDFNVEH